jgi:hypothetical protein
VWGGAVVPSSPLWWLLNQSGSAYAPALNRASSPPSGMTVSCFDFAEALAVAIGRFCAFTAEARRVG